jgi:hypothetical protein
MLILLVFIMSFYVNPVFLQITNYQIIIVIFYLIMLTFVNPVKQKKAPKSQELFVD